MIAPLLLAAAVAATPGPAPAPAAATTPAPAPAPAAATTPAAIPMERSTLPPASTRPTPGLRSDKPVRMDAEEMRFSWKTRQVTVVGKPLVTLLHDDATLTCRKLTGENDQAGKLKVATCEGDVKLVRGPRNVTCDRATYDRDAARVVCTGNPVLKDEGGTEARATVLTWDLGADEVRLEGAAQVTVPGDQLDKGTSGLAPAAKPPEAK